jgi:hypothetical protein
MSVITHLQACDDELLGKIVRTLASSPDGGLSLSDAVYRTQLARETIPESVWTCACARIQLARLTTRIDTARKRNAPEYEDLLVERRKLSALLGGGEGE